VLFGQLSKPENMKSTHYEITLTRLGSGQTLQSKWVALQERVKPSFFLTWHWIGTWLEYTGIRPLVLEARQGDRTVALALLQPSDHRSQGRFPGKCIYLHQTGVKNHDRITIEYNGILADTSAAPDVVDACFEYLIHGKDGVPHWDELYLSGVEPQYTAYFSAHKDLKLIPREKLSVAIDLDAVRRTGQSYLDSLSSNTRYQIRRAIRLYEQMGELKVEAAPDVETALAFLDDIGPMHTRHWASRGSPSGFTDTFFISFHTALISRGLPTGEIDLLRIRAGEHLIGYLYNFVYNRHVYFYLSAFNYQDDPKIKPGLVSHALAVTHYLNKGALIYDFMAGTDRYKTNLGNTKSHLLWLIVQKRRLKFRLEDTLRRIKHGLQREGRDQGES
jgi:CelD/BcsL family acetyltransferase involved in cellulose biosynthesis